jgi:hypothetical protein
MMQPKCGTYMITVTHGGRTYVAYPPTTIPGLCNRQARTVLHREISRKQSFKKYPKAVVRVWSLLEEGTT